MTLHCRSYSSSSLKPQSQQSSEALANPCLIQSASTSLLCPICRYSVCVSASESSVHVVNMQVSRQQGRGLTKAIVFSQFWMHSQLISSHLRAHEVPLAVLKQDMSPKDKAAAVATFQVRHVHFKQSVRESFGRCAGHCGLKSRI